MLEMVVDDRASIVPGKGGDENWCQGKGEWYAIRLRERKRERESEIVGKFVCYAKYGNLQAPSC